MQQSDLNNLLEVLADGVAIIDASARIEHANPAFAELFGYRPGDLHGQSIDVLIPATARAEHHRHVTRFRQGNERHLLMGTRGVLQAQARDGSSIAVSISISRMTHPDGERFVAVVREVTAQLEHYEKLSGTDHLTGVANRMRLSRHVDTLLANHADFSILYIDLDGFKPINDAHGHSVGDAVLKIVARRLQNAVRDSDLVARVGGDEFAVVVDGAGSRQSLRALIEHLRSRVQARVHVGDFNAPIGLSIGHASSPRDGTSQAELLARADALMYADKRLRQAARHAAPGHRHSA